MSKVGDKITINGSTGTVIEKTGDIITIQFDQPPTGTDWHTVEMPDPGVKK